MSEKQVDAKVLYENGFIRTPLKPVKILGAGELKKPIIITATEFSRSAKEKIEKVGGKTQNTMIEKLKSIFIIPELRQRILFTVGVLVVVRIGAHIPIPGVNGEILAEAFTDMKTGLFGLFNTFVGGAFEKASFFFRNNAIYILFNYYSTYGICGSLFPKTTERR